MLAATGHRWTLHHGLRRGAVVPALGTFKLGVELGQVAIVSIVTPALAGLDRVLAADPDVAPARSTALVIPCQASSRSWASIGCSIAPLWPDARTVIAAKQKRRDGMTPSRPNFCNSLVQALRAPCCQASTGLAGDPSEVTALGVRHWITSFHC